MEGKPMIRLGTVVCRNSRRCYACEILDAGGQIVGYAVFDGEGNYVEGCESVQKVETLLIELESAGSPDIGIR